jgi:hypothetical protein
MLVEERPLTSGMLLKEKRRVIGVEPENTG